MTTLYKFKTLSVKEPWASLIFKCGKDVENRSWYTPYRGPLLIHASKSVDLEKDKWSITNCYQRNWFDLKTRLSLNGVQELPSLITDLDINPGHILGLVWLKDCIKNSHSPWAFDGNYHWLLSNPIPFNCSYPLRGQLGLFDSIIPLEPSVAEKLSKYKY